MSTPLASIIMPVYNAETFLYQAIQSIYSQTFTDWELIMIDDASTDRSLEIMQKIDDPRVKILANSKNMKQSYSQNRGIDIARGKLVFRMDADDISLPRRIEKQLDYLISNPSVDVVGCGSYCVYGDLVPFLATRPVESHEEIVRFASMNFPLLHGGLAGKVEWFKKWKADTRMRFAQDFDLLFRAHTTSTFGNVSEPLYVVRFVGGTIPVSRKIMSVYYKSLSLLKNGFRMKLYKDTLIGLASMAPRPLLYLMKAAIGRNEMGLVKSQGVRIASDDITILKKELNQIQNVKVPIKGCSMK